MYTPKKGDFIIIKSRGLGGEVVSENPVDGKVLVRVATMCAGHCGVVTNVRDEWVEVSGLEQIKKRKGVIIV